jgi:hypothetical protein
MAEQALGGAAEPGALHIDVESFAATVAQCVRLPGDVCAASVADGKISEAKQWAATDTAV